MCGRFKTGGCGPIGYTCGGIAGIQLGESNYDGFVVVDLDKPPLENLDPVYERLTIEL